ncbi:MAG: hypothetical protein LBM73_03885 [Candidatus Nomurabacteria bacterium]|nr:hypothetical protein [Candidatus Nomurabacteria bacterium]
MIIADFLTWWYAAGWRGQLGRIGQSFARASDQFSIPLLLRTLFQPFRQIAADDGGRSLQEKFSAALNKLFSRAVGAVMRIFMMIAGVIVLILLGILSLIRLVLWPLLPLLPIVGIILTIKVGAL